MKRKYIAVLIALIIPGVVFAQVIYPNRGGTGNSTAPSANDILIGNGSTFDLKTLTAGTNVTISTAGSAVTVSAELEGGGLATTDIDTEAELEALVTDVSDFFTDNDGALSDDDLSNNSTSDLSEGSNLYYTNARVSSYLTSGTGINEASGALSFDCSDVEGAGINCVSEAITLDATGDWTGTFDGYEAAALLDDTTLTEEQVEDFIGGMLGGTETLITVTYQDATGDIDFVVNDALSAFTNDAGFVTTSDDTVSATELDGVFSTTGLLRRTGATTYSTITDNSTNWDTAFGWGDHSSGGYLITVDISDDTNLTGDSEIVLTGDTLSIAPSIARDTELHSALTIAGEDYLTLATQELTAVAINPDNLASADFGDFSCNGTSCSFDTGTVSDAEIDYATVTLDDLTFDVGSVSKTEYGYLNGVTSALQTQLDAKLETVASSDIDDDTITFADIADSAQATTKCIWFEDPTADDDFQSIWANKTANNFLITEIWAESDQTVNFDLQIDDGTPADVNGTDISPAAGEAEDTSLSGDTTLAAGEELDLVVTSVSGTPTWVSICFTGNWVD